MNIVINNLFYVLFYKCRHELENYYFSKKKNHFFRFEKMYSNEFFI